MYIHMYTPPPGAACSLSVARATFFVGGTRYIYIYIHIFIHKDTHTTRHTHMYAYRVHPCPPCAAFLFCCANNILRRVHALPVERTGLSLSPHIYIIYIYSCVYTHTHKHTYIPPPRAACSPFVARTTFFGVCTLYIHIYTHSYIYTPTQPHTHTYSYMYIYTHSFPPHAQPACFLLFKQDSSAGARYIYIYMCIYIYMYMYICIFISIYTHTFIHIYSPRPPPYPLPQPTYIQLFRSCTACLLSAVQTTSCGECTRFRWREQG